MRTRKHAQPASPTPFQWREYAAMAADAPRRRPRKPPTSGRELVERILAPKWGGAYSKAVPSRRAESGVSG